MVSTILPAVSALALIFTVAAADLSPSGNHAWSLKNFKSLVAFGDSYTDESRLGYFISHNGSAPPVGWVQPDSNSTADGGRIWVSYVNQYSGANIYDYAVSGAVCSNEITPRFFSYINIDFPAVKDYEIPAFIADSEYKEPDGTNFLDIPVDETVYTMWIGTNDLGVWAFITDSQVKGKNLVSYTDCVFNQLNRLYQHGARNFVLLNNAPLNLAPLYGLPNKGGVGDNQYWPNKPSNLTEISYRMLEEVVTTNNIFQWQLPANVVAQKMWPGAQFALYDVHGLITDIYNHPKQYLNGTSPLNVTGFAHQCNYITGVCVTDPSPDSFLWYDELHPSEQTERVIAANFVDVVKGSSKWATYWS